MFGSVRWRGGRLAFSIVKCLKGLFIHRAEPKQWSVRSVPDDDVLTKASLPPFQVEMEECIISDALLWFSKCLICAWSKCRIIYVLPLTVPAYSNSVRSKQPVTPCTSGQHETITHTAINFHYMIWCNAF